MSILYTTKYRVKHPILRHLIKYFWVLKSDSQMVVNHKLLPVNSIDMIMNFAEPIKYISADGVETVTAKAHFNGIRDRYFIIQQAGIIDVIGISFFSAGVYPLLKVPLYEFKNKTMELDDVISRFAAEIEEKISKVNQIEERLDIIEEEMVRRIDSELILEFSDYKYLNTFYGNNSDYNVNQFCTKQGISQRKLERDFNKYVGISPIVFQKINRYQKTLNAMLYNRAMNLTATAYANNYYDQNHFIKDFKSFTGCTPTTFLRQKSAVKQIMTVS